MSGHSVGHTCCLSHRSRGDPGAVVAMAPYLFAAGNVAIGILVLGTLRLAIRGQLLPKPLVAVQS